MDAAAWGAIGTVVGGGLTFVGTVFATRNQQRHADAAAEARRADELRHERKEAYLRLLGVVRRLRFHARGNGYLSDGEEIDLRSELSRVSYEIDLIAPASVAAIAAELADATRAYLRASRMDDGVSAAEPGGGEPESSGLRVQVRELVDRFIAAARSDLA